jgi:hypothetical protein
MQFTLARFFRGGPGWGFGLQIIAGDGAHQGGIHGLYEMIGETDAG